MAHNEERAIGATLSSLLAQSVFADPALAKDLIIVANGCSDATVARAQAAIAGLSSPNTAARVVDVREPGKANAWNIFIHRESAPDTDIFVLLDADIEFASPDAIEKLIAKLDADADVLVAPDQPVKRFSEGGGPLKPFIRALQKSGGDGDHALSGQLYAARASALRAIVMPTGIVVEDGFLRAMILTQSFSTSEIRKRITRAPGVRHFYAPYENFGDIWKYERRQAAGTTINRWIYDAFRDWRANGLEIRAETMRRNAEDPQWLDRLIAERVAGAGVIAAPRRYVLRRLRQNDNWGLKNILKAPLIAAAIVYDVAVAFAASEQLRKRAQGSTHWETIRKP